MSLQAIKSPCIKVCAVDGQTGWCLGCGRSLKEISYWTKYTEQQRAAVMKDLETRIAKLKASGKLG